MTMKSVAVYFAIFITFGFSLIYFIQSKTPSKNIDSTISLASPLIKEVSTLETWVGEYSFSEYAPPNQNMFYSITIYYEDNNYFAKISIDGFQTLERLLAKVSGDTNSIKLEFLEYLPDNIFEPYKQGEVLLSLEKRNFKLITHWGGIQPLVLKNEKEGEYFKLDSSSIDSK